MECKEIFLLLSILAHKRHPDNYTQIFKELPQGVASLTAHSPQTVDHAAMVNCSSLSQSTINSAGPRIQRRLAELFFRHLTRPVELGLFTFSEWDEVGSMVSPIYWDVVFST